MFQKYVILDSNKTGIDTDAFDNMFQKYVILDSNKTISVKNTRATTFQKYVILDSNKTQMKMIVVFGLVLEVCYFRQ